MKLYQKLLIENSNNAEKVSLINDRAAHALYLMGLKCDHAIITSDVKENGLLDIEFVKGQDIYEYEVVSELQEIFDEEFANAISEEHAFDNE